MSEGAQTTKSGPPAPSPQLLQKLGVSLEQWQDMEPSEKKALLQKYLSELEARVGQSSDAPAERTFPSTEASFLQGYYQDDATVRAPEASGPVVFKTPDKETDKAKDGVLFGRLNKKNSGALGFAVTDEEPGPESAS